MSREELGAYIANHLKKYGIEITLAGGSCVSIYSDERYVTSDLDFVETTDTKRKILANYLKEIGFYEEDRFFKHPETNYFIDFLAGPLAVGAEPIMEIIKIDTEMGSLKLISPTECVKDRLAAYFFWNDLQCLQQAILVAKYNKIDIDEVRRWAEKEGELEKFKKFYNRIYK